MAGKTKVETTCLKAPCEQNIFFITKILSETLKVPILTGIVTLPCGTIKDASHVVCSTL